MILSGGGCSRVLSLYKHLLVESTWVPWQQVGGGSGGSGEQLTGTRPLTPEPRRLPRQTCALFHPRLSFEPAPFPFTSASQLLNHLKPCPSELDRIQGHMTFSFSPPPQAATIVDKMSLSSTVSRVMSQHKAKLSQKHLFF